MLGLILSEMIFFNFKITGRVDKLVDLFTKLNTKVEKKPTFCFNIFVDVLGEWNHLYMFKVFLTLFLLVRDPERKTKNAFFLRIVIIIA